MVLSGKVQVKINDTIINIHFLWRARLLLTFNFFSLLVHGLLFLYNEHVLHL